MKESAKKKVTPISTELPRAKCLELIKCYEDRSVLWDVNNVQHRREDVKSKAWEEVAALMALDVDQCKMKMYQLIAYLKREMGRIREREAAGKNRVPKWYAYKHFDFLIEDDDLKLERLLTAPRSKKPRRTKMTKMKNAKIVVPRMKKIISSEIMHNSDEDSSTAEKPSQSGMSNEESILSENQMDATFAKSKFQGSSIQNEIFMEEDILGIPETEDNGSLLDNGVQNPHRRSIPIEENMPVVVEYETSCYFPENAIKEAEQNWVSIREDDECRSFGIFIGNKLRNYSKRTRSMVQHAISDIFFSADQGKLGD